MLLDVASRFVIALADGGYIEGHQPGEADAPVAAPAAPEPVAGSEDARDTHRANLLWLVEQLQRKSHISQDETYTATQRRLEQERQKLYAMTDFPAGSNLPPLSDKASWLRLGKALSAYVQAAGGETGVEGVRTALDRDEADARVANLVLTVFEEAYVPVTCPLDDFLSRFINAVEGRRSR